MLNNLYKILEQKSDFLSIRLSDEKHKIFKAHFPSNPLLPGFLLIDICQEEFKFSIKKIKKISFLKPILPNENIEFKLQIKPKSFHVDILRDKIVVAFMDFEVF